MKYTITLLALACALSACSGEKAPTETHAAAPAHSSDSARVPAAPAKTPLTDPDVARTPTMPPVLPPKPVDPIDIDTRSTDPVGTDATVVDTQKGKDAGSAGMSDSLTKPGVAPKNTPQNAPGDTVATKPPTDALAGAKPVTKDAGKETAARLGTMDVEFVSKAIVGGMFEVQSSELAVSQATTPFVREFAQMMVMDHGDANRDLEQMAKAKGATIPTELDAEHQSRLDTLRDQKGVDFDRQYRDMQVSAHSDAIALFERASTSCEDAELKAFAAKLLPTLREHQKKLTEMPPTEGN